MKKLLCILLAGMVAIATTGTSQNRRDSLLCLLPASGVLPGWSMTDSARIYGGTDLYLFIDGGADLFFEYGFRQVVAAEYSGGGTASIDLQIYEMNDPGAAFGIYSIRSGGEAKPIDLGQGGSVHPYYIMFWKGRFYVSIAASDSSAACRSGLEVIARAVDRRFPPMEQKPRTVELLPTDHLMKAQYFRGPLGLASLRLLDMEEMFPAIDGAAGTYDDHVMIVLKYNNGVEADQRMLDITSKLRSDKRFKELGHREGITRVIDRKSRTICLGRSGSQIVVSVSAAAGVAESWCRKVITELEQR